MKFADHVQNFGRSLSAMVMPNIGAFIAWGLITAIFIPTGWWPNEHLNALVKPMLTYLLPLLIAYTAGSNVAGIRGGVIACISTAGVIVGSDVPMFIGAMIMGPLSAWIIKKFDKAVEGHIKAGFEMLVNNFSVGIIGMILAIIGFCTIGHVMSSLTSLFAAGIMAMKNLNVLPMVSVFIEPAKVMFLNNAINHGILTPLGTVQAEQFGESIIFILESNPGPGFGLLMAYWIFGRGPLRDSAPGAVLIQFIGGIHEIYYPYVLARPAIIIAPILGSMSCIFFLTLVGAGLVAPISPGSVISVILMSPKGKTFILLAGVFIAAAVSFLVAAPFVKKASRVDAIPQNRFTPKYKLAKEANKESFAGKKSVNEIHHIVFACDAGMGSSALGATRFRKRIESIVKGIVVSNASVSSVPQDADVVVCMTSLRGRAEHSAPWAEIVCINNFLEDEALDELYYRFAAPTSTPVLKESSILLGVDAQDKWDAIRIAGEVLRDGGYVTQHYVDAMKEREERTTTCMGMGLAIPHGTEEAKADVMHSGISIVQIPNGVDFDGEKVTLVVGIAGVGDEHLEILAKVSEALDEEETLNRLKTTTDKEEILRILA